MARKVRNVSRVGANNFKHLQPAISRKRHLIRATVGTFVGMLFHNGAQSAAPRALGSGTMQM